MSEAEQNIDVPDNDILSAGTSITLPDELAEWATQNQELVLRVQNALTDTYDRLSEEQLWETIAMVCSPEWVDARTAVRVAEAHCDDLNSPEKASLGAIGSALDSDETNEAQGRLALSLAHFTVINEGLRQRDDLSKLLGVLLVQKRMLELSAERTQALQRTTADFASLTSEFEKAAAVSATNHTTSARAPSNDTGLRRIFGLHAVRRLLSRGDEEAPAPRNAPVPSSPKI